MAPDDPEIYFLVHGYYNFQIRKIQILQINFVPEIKLGNFGFDEAYGLKVVMHPLFSKVL